jgi:hypothetical protein
VLKNADIAMRGAEHLRMTDYKRLSKARSVENFLASLPLTGVTGANRALSA